MFYYNFFFQYEFESIWISAKLIRRCRPHSLNQKLKMALLTRLCFACVLTNFIAASSDMCEVMTINISIFQRNQRLNGFQFYDSIDVPNIFQCAMMCFFRRRCLSFNYFENSSLCEFNNARVDAPYVILNSTTHCVYSDIDDWDKVKDISLFNLKRLIDWF